MSTNTKSDAAPKSEANTLPDPAPLAAALAEYQKVERYIAGVGTVLAADLALVEHLKERRRPVAAAVTERIARLKTHIRELRPELNEKTVRLLQATGAFDAELSASIQAEREDWMERWEASLSRTLDPKAVFSDSELEEARALRERLGKVPLIQLEGDRLREGVQMQGGAPFPVCVLREWGDGNIASPGARAASLIGLRERISTQGGWLPAK